MSEVENANEKQARVRLTEKCPHANHARTKNRRIGGLGTNDEIHTGTCKRGICDQWHNRDRARASIVDSDSAGGVCRKYDSPTIIICIL
jgi:hypothetical protein